MLQISNLSFSYQNQPLLENLNLSLAGSEIVGIIGDNGAGKTTLLRLIAGELQPDNGSIKIVGSVGFLRQTQNDLEDKSGGERTQIRLAELFRQNPETMLLDEPTNNLDYETKTWLIRKLHEHRRLILVASHDRDFLKAVANKIIYLHNRRAEIFFGDYVSFRTRQTQTRREQSQNYERLQQEKKKLKQQLKNVSDRAHGSNRRGYNKISNESKLHYNGQRVTAQNSAGKVLRATQSRINQLTAVEIEKPLEHKTYSAKLSSNFLHNRKLLEVESLAKSYGKKELFKNLSFAIYTGERIRICGCNGSGKSTLFRIVLGEVRPDSGKIWIGPDVEIGYISQEVMGLDLEKSFLAQNENFDKTEVFRAATTMDLTPQDIGRPVYELSRGQLTKLAILRLLLHPLDLVIIDELTNHIDIRARENIESALKNYRGAILAATHDETFAQAIEFSKNIHI